jgi:hypothetical protein
MVLYLYFVKRWQSLSILKAAVMPEINFGRERMTIIFESVQKNIKLHILIFFNSNLGHIIYSFFQRTHIVSDAVVDDETFLIFLYFYSFYI